MNIEDFLKPECTLKGLDSTSVKRLFESIADTIALPFPEMDSETLFDRLTERERIGSTGLGEGVALPHCRLPDCTHPIGALFTLVEPIEFDSIDQKPVDLVFVLIVPEAAVDEHLQLLKAIAENFGNADYRDRLRQAVNDSDLYETAVAGI